MEKAKNLIADHRHLLLTLNPKVAPSVFINNLITVPSRLIRKEFSEQLKKVYGEKPVFWSSIGTIW